MIPSTPSSNRPLRPDSTPPISPKSSGPAAGPGADQLSFDKIELLRQALAAQPEIRSEVVERGRALAADPSWPTPDILRKVSEIILRAPDLSEDLA
jgi:hypothetical protein